MPHSALPVIGSMGTRRRNFSLRPEASPAAVTPSTSFSSVCRIALAARRHFGRRDQPLDPTASLKRSMRGAHLAQVAPQLRSLRCRCEATVRQRHGRRRQDEQDADDDQQLDEAAAPRSRHRPAGRAHARRARAFRSYFAVTAVTGANCSAIGRAARRGTGAGYLDVGGTCAHRVEDERRQEPRCPPRRWCRPGARWRCPRDLRAASARLLKRGLHAARAHEAALLHGPHAHDRRVVGDRQRHRRQPRRAGDRDRQRVGTAAHAEVGRRRRDDDLARRSRRRRRRASEPASRRSCSRAGAAGVGTRGRRRRSQRRGVAAACRCPRRRRRGRACRSRGGYGASATGLRCTMIGGGPASPRFCCVPTKIGVDVVPA